MTSAKAIPETVTVHIPFHLVKRGGRKEMQMQEEAEIPPIWIDSTQRIPYKEFQEDTGPLNQILIRQNGNLVDLKEVSAIVEAIRPFRLDRAYIPFPTDDLKARVNDTIKAKSKEAKGE